MHCGTFGSSHRHGRVAGDPVFKVRRRKTGCPPAGHDAEMPCPTSNPSPPPNCSASIAGASSRPVEVTRDQLDRIEKFEPAINAFIIVDRDGALEGRRRPPRRAGRRASRSASSTALGATVKDNVWLEGLPVAPRLAHQRPTHR